MKYLRRVIAVGLAFMLPIDPSTAASLHAHDENQAIHLAESSSQVFEQQAVVEPLTEFWNSLSRQARVHVRQLRRRFIEAPNNEYPTILQEPEVVADLHNNKRPYERKLRIKGVRFIHAAMRLVPAAVWTIGSAMSVISGFVIDFGWRRWLEAVLHRPVNVAAHRIWNLGPVPLTLPEPISPEQGRRNVLDFITALRGEGDIALSRQHLLTQGAFAIPAQSVDINGAVSAGIYFGTRGKTRYLLRLDVPVGAPINVTPTSILPDDPSSGILLRLNSGNKEWYFRLKNKPFFIEPVESLFNLYVLQYAEAVATESDLTKISSQLLNAGSHRMKTRGYYPSGTRLLFGSALGKQIVTTLMIPPDSEVIVTPIAVVPNDPSFGVYLKVEFGKETWYLRFPPKKGTLEIIYSPEVQNVESFAAALWSGEDITATASVLLKTPTFEVETTMAGRKSRWSQIAFGTVQRIRVASLVFVPPRTKLSVSFIPIIEGLPSAGVYMRVENKAAVSPEERFSYYQFRKEYGYLRAIGAPQTQNVLNYIEAFASGKDIKQVSRALLTNGSWTIKTRPTPRAGRSRLYFGPLLGTQIEALLDVPGNTIIQVTPRPLFPNNLEAGAYLELQVAGKPLYYWFKKEPHHLQRTINPGMRRISQYVDALIQGQDLSDMTRQLVLNGSFELELGKGGQADKNMKTYVLYMGAASTPTNSKAIMTVLKLSEKSLVRITPIMQSPDDYSAGADLRLETQGRTDYLRFKPTYPFVDKIFSPFSENVRDYVEAIRRGNDITKTARRLVTNGSVSLTTRAIPSEPGRSVVYFCYADGISFDYDLPAPPETSVQVIPHYVDPSNPIEGLFFEVAIGPRKWFLRFDARLTTPRRISVRAHWHRDLLSKGNEGEEQADPRILRRIAELHPELSEVPSLEDELEFIQNSGSIRWAEISDRTKRHLIQIVSQDSGVHPWLLTHQQIDSPHRLFAESDRVNSLSGLFGYYEKARRQLGVQCLGRDFMLADLGIVGPQIYSEGKAQQPTSWQRLERMAEILGTKRVYVDLDETLFWPAGWMGTEDWLAERRKQSPTTAYNELVDMEVRMAQAGYMVPTDPEAKAVIERLRAKGVQFVGITSRSRRMTRRVGRILTSIGVDIPVLYVGSRKPEAKVKRIAKEQQAHGQVPTLYVDNDIASLEAAEAARVPDLKVAFYESNRPSHWKDPNWYLEQAQGHVSESKMAIAQEDLINALELCSYLAISEDDRLSIVNRAASLIDQIKASSIDSSPVLRAFLRQGCDILINRNGNGAHTISEPFESFLDHFFGYYFPSNAPSMVQYYKDGLLMLRKRQAVAREDYYFVIDETNVFPFIDPILRRILHEKPQKVILIDSGARPLAWAIEAFVKAMNLPTDVCMLPLSLKTKGDTLKTTRHWLEQGKALAEGRVALDAIEEGAREAVTAFAQMFPLAGESVLLLDDNLSGGDTFDVARRALSDQSVSDLSGAVIWALQDAKIDRSQLTQTFESPGQASWSKGRYPPVAIQSIWEGNLSLRGIKSRGQFNGNPIPEALMVEDADYPVYRGFRERLVSTFVEHLAKYTLFLEAAPTRAGPRLPGPTDTAASDDQRLDIYKTHTPIKPPLPEFSITVAGQTLTCRPVHSPEELREYVTRTDARPMDHLGDQLLYPDLTLYRIFNEKNQSVGVLEVVQGITRRPALKDRALVLDYVDLNYQTDIDPQAFAHALAIAMTQLAESSGVDWLLIPGLGWMLAGRPEITAAFTDEEPYRFSPVLWDFVLPQECASGAEMIRHYNENPAMGPLTVKPLQERLSSLFEGPRLTEADERARLRYQQGLLDYEIGHPIDPSWARLLRYRFRSLSRNRFRVLWRKIPEKQKARLEPFHQRLEAIRPYIFDDYERRMAGFVAASLAMGMELMPWQMAFLKRLERRREFFENSESPAADWQNRFLPKRADAASWTPEDKLSYQALEFYSLKVDLEDEDRPRYPPNFFDGPDGLTRATAIAKYVIFEKHRLFDLRALNTRFFIENDLQAVWERAFNRNLFNAAESLYPGQYDLAGNQLQPKPLTTDVVLQCMSGKQTLAPGRTLQRVVPSNSVWIGGRSPDAKRLATGTSEAGPVFITSILDPDLGVGLAFFDPATFERWQHSDSTAYPNSVYFKPQNSESPVLTPSPFVLKLNEYRKTGKAPHMAQTSRWTFAAANVKLKTNVAGGLEGRINFSAVSFGIPSFSMNISPKATKTFDVRNDEKVIVAFAEDPNHGSVVQIFRTADFNIATATPKGMVSPLATYKFIEGKFMPVDLAVLDLLAYNRGELHLKAMGRSWEGNKNEISASGGCRFIASLTIGDDYLDSVQFNFTKEETQQWNLETTPAEFRLAEDQNLGTHVEIWVEKDGAKHLIGTNFLYRGYNVRVDPSRLAMTAFARGDLGPDGHLIEPQGIYFHESTVQENGNLRFRLRGDFYVSFPSSCWPALVGKHPVFVPERNLQFGWLVKVHDADAYRLDRTRSPDLILVRDLARKTLVPLEDFQNRTITSEERSRFETIAGSTHLHLLLSTGAAIGPMLYRYLQLKFPGQFTLGKMPILVQDWLSRLPRAPHEGTTVSPSGPVSGGMPRLARESMMATPSSEIPPTSSEAATDALSSMHRKTVYRDFVENQEATMTRLQDDARNNPDAEWRTVCQKVLDYFRRIITIELPELTPTARLLMKLFQLEGTQFLIDHPEGALWDDPGLGKTLQALAAALHIPRRDPKRANLISAVVPASGVKVWRDELKKWARYSHDVIVVGTGGVATLYQSPEDEKGQRMSLQEALARYETSPPQHSPFVLVTYDALKGNFYDLWTHMASLRDNFPNIPSDLFGSFEEFTVKYQRYDPNWTEARIVDGLLETLRPHLSAGELEKSQSDIQRHVHQVYGTYQAMRAVKPDIMIVDEAHKLRNEETLQSQALQSLTASHKIMLSGRPLLGRDRSKLFPLLHWLSPGRFPDYQQFLTKYHDTVDGRMNLWIDLQEVSLRRRKREVLLPGELPPLTPHEERLHLRPEDEPGYRQMEDDFRSWLEAEKERTGHLPSIDHIFSQLMRLTQFTSGLRHKEGKWVFDKENPKVKALDAIIHQKLDVGEKVVVFTQFVEVANELRKRYADHGVAHLTGKVTGKRRDKAIEQFQTDPATRICIATYGTGGETITLTAANNIVLYDLEYDVPEQPKDRIERLGQTRDMHLYTLIAENTIDEDLLTLHAQKQEVFDQIIEGFFPPDILFAELANTLAEGIAGIGEGMTTPLTQVLEAFLAKPDTDGPNTTNGGSFGSNLGRMKAVDLVIPGVLIEGLLIFLRLHPLMSIAAILISSELYLLRGYLIPMVSHGFRESTRLLCSA